MAPLEPTELQGWLRRPVWLYVIGRVAAAVALLLLGAGVLFVEYWLVVGFGYFVLSRFGVPADYYALIAGVFLALLFVGNIRTDRQYLTEFSVTAGTYNSEVVTFYLPHMGLVSNINPLAPDTMHTGVKIITSLLYTGPRVIVAAWRCLCSALRMFAVDTRACAGVIAFLYARPGRADFRSIVAGVADVNPVTTFPQLARLDGVLVLKSEPAGFALSSDWRSALDAQCADATHS
ncbi:MAG TPA: hypothetical protein P5572_07765 [Phycisphaerae bacterium]|nr:hypothetical protein [Phycisphaerae bacterium]